MYTVIAYKPDSNDYCMGCHMASYSSDMQWLSSENEEEVAQFIAEFIKKNHFSECGEDNYEFTYLYNGLENPYDEDSDSCPFDDILKDAELLAKDKIKQQEEKDREYKILQEKQKQEEIRQREYQKYLKLQEKFKTK